MKTSEKANLQETLQSSVFFVNPEGRHRDTESGLDGKFVTRNHEMLWIF